MPRPIRVKKTDPAAKERKKRVFRAIVREYVRTAEPVASGILTVRYRFGVSPATIRNDMAELEQAGLIEQPHTSAGRVPTESGYRAYAAEFAGQAELSERQRRWLAESTQALKRDGDAVGEFAKSVANLAEQTVVLSFGPNRTWLAGVTNLTRQPEFREANMLLAVSRAIDDLDRVVGDVKRHLAEEIEVLIGRDNPFGEDMSSLVVRLESRDLGEGLAGILGPKRMDYEANYALLRQLKDLLAKM